MSEDHKKRASYIDLLTRKIVDTRIESFDSLMPPCSIYNLISVDDIKMLHKIATSAKLSTKPKEKYALINDIMTARGFKKIASGTNRVVYKFMEDQRFVLKIAYDSVGLADNPREYYNQQFLKPYVTKIFEVTPCGTVALVERTNPITNRDQFASVAEYISDIIFHFVYTKGFVIDDFGTHFFMNWGVSDRGPVILDYPYVYELDGEKLICKKPSTTHPGLVCGGEIDYDDGFNTLICKRCGAHYLATELSYKKIRQKSIVEKGDLTMKLTFVQGDQVVNTIDTNKTTEVYVKPSPNYKGKNPKPIVYKKPEVYKNPEMSKAKCDRSRVYKSPYERRVESRIPVIKPTIIDPRKEAANPVIPEEVIPEIVETIETETQPTPVERPKKVQINSVYGEQKAKKKEPADDLEYNANFTLHDIPKVDSLYSRKHQPVEDIEEEQDEESEVVEETVEEDIVEDKYARAKEILTIIPRDVDSVEEQDGHDDSDRYSATDEY